MKINTHAKLYYQDLIYRMISTKPIVPDWPPLDRETSHDRYLVVPFQEYHTNTHGYIRAIDVPKDGYAIEFVEEITIEVAELSQTNTAMGMPDEPELDHVTDPNTNEYIPVEELSVNK